MYFVFLTWLSFATSSTGLVLGPSPMQRRSHLCMEVNKKHDLKLSTSTVLLSQEHEENSNNRLISEPFPDSPSPSATSISKEKSNVWDYALLNFVAILFGSQHVVIKVALQDYHNQPALLNLWRFSLSALLFLPSLISLLSPSTSSSSISSSPSSTSSSSSSSFDSASETIPSTPLSSSIPNRSALIKAGLELGVYTFLGFAFQGISLQTISASHSAFLLYLNVKFVPFLSILLFQRRIPLSTWISASLAVLGTFLLASEKIDTPLSSSMSTGELITAGDLWSVAAALASAMFILKLEKFAQDFNASQLNR